MGQFDGKVVAITGGGRGQGRSHAVEFARQGADVAICDIASSMEENPYPLATTDDLEETARLVRDLGRRCVAVKADVRDHEQVRAFVDETLSELGRVDFLLANAGIAPYGKIVDVTQELWNAVIDTNLRGVFNVIQAALPTMQKQGFGRIVVTSSMGGRMGYPNCGPYCATKWGVIGLAKSLAIEVAAEGINVNVVCPTAVNTDMIHNDATYAVFVPDITNPTREDAAPRLQALNHIPVPWIEPIDISRTMVFLCSEGGRYITGETIGVNAGMSASNTG